MKYEIHSTKQRYLYLVISCTMPRKTYRLVLLTVRAVPAADASTAVYIHLLRPLYEYAHAIKLVLLVACRWTSAGTVSVESVIFVVCHVWGLSYLRCAMFGGLCWEIGSDITAFSERGQDVGLLVTLPGHSERGLGEGVGKWCVH